MTVNSFATSLDNKWLYKIVEDSLVFSKIMEDVEREVPELIKYSSKKED